MCLTSLCRPSSVIVLYPASLIDVPMVSIWSQTASVRGVSVRAVQQAVAANVPCASGLVTVADLSESDFIFLDSGFRRHVAGLFVRRLGWVSLASLFPVEIIALSDWHDFVAAGEFVEECLFQFKRFVGRSIIFLYPLLINLVASLYLLINYFAHQIALF